MFTTSSRRVLLCAFHTYCDHSETYARMHGAEHVAAFTGAKFPPPVTETLAQHAAQQGFTSTLWLSRRALKEHSVKLRTGALPVTVPLEPAAPALHLVAVSALPPPDREAFLADAVPPEAACGGAASTPFYWDGHKWRQVPPAAVRDARAGTEDRPNLWLPVDVAEAIGLQLPDTTPVTTVELPAPCTHLFNAEQTTAPLDVLLPPYRQEDELSRKQRVQLEQGRFGRLKR